MNLSNCFGFIDNALNFRHGGFKACRESIQRGVRPLRFLKMLLMLIAKISLIAIGSLFIRRFCYVFVVCDAHCCLRYD